MSESKRKRLSLKSKKSSVQYQNEIETSATKKRKITKEQHPNSEVKLSSRLDKIPENEVAEDIKSGNDDPVCVSDDELTSVNQQIKNRMSDESTGRTDALLNAVDTIRRTGLSIRKVAIMYKIPESTLRSRIHNPSLFSSKIGRPTVFTEAEESQLAVHCRKMAELGYGYNRKQVLAMAANFMKLTGRATEPKKDWYYGFVKRYPELAIQKPKKKEISKTKDTTESHLENYYQELEKIIAKYDLQNKAGAIWNVDETGLNLDHDPPKVLVRKGEGSSDQNATTTVIVAGSALGETIPPYVIYKGQRLTAPLTAGCLPQTKFTTTANGLSTSATFQDFIENHFMTHVPTRPCLLLYDGHSSHITVNLIDRVRESGIHMFVLPPHSSRQSKTSDVGIFSLFKTAISSECHKFYSSKAGRQVNSSDLPSLIATAYKSALTIPNLQSSFRKTGIISFSPEKVQSESESPVAKTKPKQTKVKNIKLLLTNIDENTKKAKEVTSVRRRKCGAAITEKDFLNMLNKRKQSALSKSKTIKQPVSSDESVKSPTTKKSRKPKKIRKTKTVEESSEKQADGNGCSEVKDSEEAGPSNNRKEWLTFYESQSGEDDNDDELCSICHTFAPKGFEQSGGVELVKWAKCHVCNGWVHLKYCSPITHVNDGDCFSCSKCQSEELSKTLG